MAGSLCFGIAYHLLVPGPDNLFTLPSGPWNVPFGDTAALLVVGETVGCLVAWSALRAVPARAAERARPPHRNQPIGRRTP